MKHLSLAISIFFAISTLGASRHVSITFSNSDNLTIAAKGVYIASSSSKQCQGKNKVTGFKKVTILKTLASNNLVSLASSLNDKCDSVLSGVSLFFSTPSSEAYGAKYIAVKEKSGKSEYDLSCETDRKSTITGEILKGLSCFGEQIKLNEELRAKIKLNLKN